MGSADALKCSGPEDDGVKESKNKLAPESKKAAKNVKKNKKPAEQLIEEPTLRKRPKRAAACSDFKEKPLHILEESELIEKKQNQPVEEEAVAIRLTAGQESGKPNRRLVDYIFHNSDGIAQPLEMSEVDHIFITGTILPLEESADKQKANGVRCEYFGQIEEWNISGYDEGSPVIWVSTEIAHYDCLKPAGSYKKHYDKIFAKASACIEVYRKLSKSSGGNPDSSLDELLAGVVRAMNGMKCFPLRASIRDFIISQGEFIYKELAGLDESSKKIDQPFFELPVLLSLRDECSKQAYLAEAWNGSSIGSLTIGSKRDEENAKTQSGSYIAAEEDEDMKLAKLLDEEEQWKSMKQKRNKGSSSQSSKFYIKINEDEIANDYPLPAYYRNSNEETDEYVVFDGGDADTYYVDDLPRRMLHNWTLYNSDSRLISLELLPMKPCAEIDVTIFGSGVMTTDDGSGYDLDTYSNNSSSSGSGEAEVDGLPIFLSAIKEWMVEFGSSMIFISIRTDMAWYRLGKPSKQYAPWFEPVLKTAMLAINMITLLKEQTRVSRLSFSDVIKRVLQFEKCHPAYISSSPDIVERYVVVHGQIILQQFSEFPDAEIKKCSFVSSLAQKMEERHHTKWLIKKKKVAQRTELNLNPRATMTAVVSQRKAMQATTTRLINRIWGEYYSNYSPDESIGGSNSEVKEDNEVEERDENEEDDAAIEEKNIIPQEVHSTDLVSKGTKLHNVMKENIEWAGESVGRTSNSESLYKMAIIQTEEIALGGGVLVENNVSDILDIYFVEYMFQRLDGSKMFHGRFMLQGSQTVLGNAANDREIFLTNDCATLKLEEVKQIIKIDIRMRPWGHEQRKANVTAEKIDRERAEERKQKGLPTEYYCKNWYRPEKGAFFKLPISSMGLGTDSCHSCKLKDTDDNEEKFKVNVSKTSFVYQGTEYFVQDYVYVNPQQFATGKMEVELFKGGRNVGLKAYVVCQLLEIVCPNTTRQVDVGNTKVKVRRFFRPEDISADKAYSSDIREIYYSEVMHKVPVGAIEGKCEIRKKHDISSDADVLSIFDHVFFCEYIYDHAKGSLKQMSSHIKLRYSHGKHDADNDSRKKKGKGKEGDCESGNEDANANRLATLDIFAGCGGLSEGLEKSGVSVTKWAIEYEEAAGDAFKLNHPESLVFVNNCNVILRAIMQKCGDADDCISTPEADEKAGSLSENERKNLPLPGQVDFINGGPPCQGFSGMNRFNQSTWSKVQCEMILVFLSFADYYRPKYFLLENVRNLVSFNQGQTFRLTLASLLEMGYQVRFGILEAGAFGVPQARKRAFIWAASPEEVLPDWPEPMYVFAAPELKVTLSKSLQCAAVKSTAAGAPYRALTVRDTIGDLPAIGNGASKTSIEYKGDQISWFQKKIRGNAMVLTDHISKEMNELNLIRCQKIPKRPGADWRDLPDDKVKLSTGQMVDLIPWCLPNTAKRHNQWKGLFGRLDWDGNFPTSITDPQPMGKVGMCFHPEQDRIVTVRECARSQGFPDSYKFSGNILHKHRQIGNAVPPPLAYALGRKLKEAMDNKASSQEQVR